MIQGYVTEALDPVIEIGLRRGSDSLIGASLLKNCKLTIDYLRRVVRIERD